MRRVALLAGTVVLLAALAPRLTLANEAIRSQAVPGATYSGTHSGGGTVSLNVSSDGGSVTQFAATSVPGTYVTLATGPCTIPQSSIVVGTHGAAISGRTFDIDLPGYFSVVGTFDGPQHAQGTFQISYGGPQGNCSSPTLTWQATTSASPAAPVATVAPAASATPTPTPQPTPANGITVTYPAGWNLVCAPAGVVFTGAASSLYALTAAGTDYVSVPAATAAQAGQGYWAYFGNQTTVSMPTSNLSAPLSITLPAGRYVTIGNPSTQPATVSGADQVVVFERGGSASGSGGDQYRPTTILQPGQGAFAVSLAGGSAVIAPATNSSRASDRNAMRSLDAR